MKTNSFTRQVEKNIYRTRKNEINSWIMCFAYNEMHHEGWYNNRINFRKKYKIFDYEDYSYNINKKEVLFRICFYTFGYLKCRFFPYFKKIVKTRTPTTRFLIVYIKIIFY